MIYDLISNIGRYKGVSKNLDKAIAFIEENNLDTLPLGRTEVDGSRVFINVMEAHTKEAANLNFEVHKRYMDIQIDLIGTEMIQVATQPIEEVEAYDESKDIGFWTGEVDTACVMGPGRFIVCMTDELHKPGIQVGNETAIKKCVVKVER